MPASPPSSRDQRLPRRPGKAIALVILLASVANLLAYGREAVIAAFFGTSRIADAYYVGTLLPSILYIVLVAESMVPAFLPVISGIRRETQEWRVVSSVANLSSICLGIVAVGSIVFAPMLVALLAPGLDPSTRSLSIGVLRVSALMVVPMGMVGVFGAVHNGHGLFVAPALGPAAAAAVAIAFILVFGRTLGATAAAWGMVAGILVQLAIQIPGLRRLHYRHVWAVMIPDPEMREVLKLFMPLAMFAGLAQVLPVVERALASTLPIGSVSVMMYAGKVKMMPTTVVTSSLAVVFFASLSARAATGDDVGFIATLRRAMSLALFLIAPIAAIMGGVALPLVSALFQRGGFTGADSSQVAAILAVYSFGILPLALSIVMARAFYARKDMKSPLIAGLVASGVYVLSAVLLTSSFGLPGLAAASGLAQVVSLLGFGLLMGRRHRVGWRDVLGGASLRALFVAAVCGVASWGIVEFLKAGFSPAGLIGNGILLSCGAFAGILVYLLGCRLLAVPEARLVFGFARYVLGRVPAGLGRPERALASSQQASTCSWTGGGEP